MKNTLRVLIPIILVYLITNILVPNVFKGESIFIVNTLLWALLLAVTLYTTIKYNTKIWQNKKALLYLAGITATLQIFLPVFAGFFMGFGKNANVWTPYTLTIYLPYLIVPFITIELARSYVAQSINKRKPTLPLLLTSLFFTLIVTSVTEYTFITTPLELTAFMISTLIPTVATSLLATYFAYLGGFSANLTYTLIPTLFIWFSPILPNLQWQTQSMLTLAAAVIGFLLLDSTIKPVSTNAIRRTLRRRQKSKLPFWTVLLLIGLIGIWSVTGLLGFTPTVIASGSMQPTLNTGDITIIINASPNTIKVGDIIQYRTAGAPTIHRVIDIYESGGSLWFLTQGDANNAPDPDPVNERHVMGKAILTIPKLGWVSIALKDLGAKTYTALTTLPQTLTNVFTWITTSGVYLTTAISLTVYSYLIFTYKRKKKEEKT